jgi:hypothetical protein
VRNADPNIKETLENKMNFNPELEKLLEVLNVKTPQDGLKKLFKLFSKLLKLFFFFDVLKVFSNYTLQN